MLVSINLRTNLQQILFPLLDLRYDQRGEMAMMLDLLTELHHQTSIVLLENRFLYYYLFTRQRAKDLMQVSRALIVRCIKLKWHCFVFRSYIYLLRQSSILSGEQLESCPRKQYAQKSGIFQWMQVACNFLSIPWSRMLVLDVWECTLRDGD